MPDLARQTVLGNKTQTRRVAGLHSAEEEKLALIIGPDDQVHYRRPFDHADVAEARNRQGYRVLSLFERLVEKCDYQPGERRAMLTTWAVSPEYDQVKPTALPAHRVTNHFWHAGMGPKPEGFGVNRAGRFLPNVLRGVCMPMIDITAVRIERVQDISEADAIAEGIIGVEFYPDEGFPLCVGYMVGPNDGKTGLTVTAKESFQQLWNSINAKRGYGWNFNPVVSVIDFQPLKEANAN